MDFKRTFIIAEAGVNHNGCLKTAKKLIDVAVLAKADAVKFQSFSAENLVTPNTSMANYQKNNVAISQTQFDMLKKLELSVEEHHILKRYCDEKNIIFLSTPFDEINLDMLVTKIHVPIIKISSGDLNNAPFLLAVTKYKRPIILSTGMATLAEIETALQVLSFGLNNHTDEKPTIHAFKKAYFSEKNQMILRKYVTILHCTTDYPANPQTINLRAMQTLSHAFQLPVGYSDHTAGIHVPVAAVTMGASIIEKHFTLDKNLPGPDHKASLSPDELADMVANIRDIEFALGNGVKIPSNNELRNAKAARKQLIALKSIRQGELFSPKNLGIKRTNGKGLDPISYFDLLQKTAQKSYTENELISQ